MNFPLQATVSCECSYDYATKTHTNFPDRLQEVSAYVMFSNEADRNAFVALFPKFVGVKGNYCSGVDFDRRPSASFRVSLSPDGTTGAVNESGLKRVRAFTKVCAANGINIEVKTVALNHIARAFNTI